jgi:hypothetical protein
LDHLASKSDQSHSFPFFFVFVVLGGGGGGAQAKENDVKKALKKYEGVLKVKGSWARKESKKGESMVSVLTPFPPQDPSGFR